VAAKIRTRRAAPERHERRALYRRPARRLRALRPLGAAARHRVSLRPCRPRRCRPAPPRPNYDP